MSEIISEVQKILRSLANSKLKASGQKFFKENVKLYGIRTANVSNLAKTYYKKIKILKKTEIFALCQELWQSGYLEETFIACHWTYATHKQFNLEDFPYFENIVGKYINNWASCDTFCNHSVGDLVEKYPQLLKELKRFTKSTNLWSRRAAAVSLIVPAKKGKFLTDIFEIADLLLMDKEDLVQKGYGWMLKVASQAHQNEVFEYVMKNKKVMPRTALRYAIEKMPPELKKQAMAK